MEKYFERSILDELYEAKGGDFADSILKEMHKQKKEFNSLEIEERLTNKITESIEDKTIQNEILKLLNEYELEVGNEEDFWNKMYYKLGAYNCAEMKEILQNKDEKEIRNIFLDAYSDDFMDYIETNRMKILKENTEYKGLAQKIEKIKDSNINVRIFLEDTEAVQLTDVELNMILDILDLQDSMETIELKETFKLGAREMAIFLKQMKLL